MEKLFSTFKKYCLDGMDFADNDVVIWKRVLLLPNPQRKMFMDKISSELLEISSSNSVLFFRGKMITAFGPEIIGCSNVFINDNMPIITSEEIDSINNQLISIQLINNDKLSLENYSYICQLILSDIIKDKDQNLFSKALNIFGVYSTIINENVSKDTLVFLRTNHHMDDKAFKFIYSNIDDEIMTDYINDFDPNELSDVYLSCINLKCLSNGLSDDLLKRMLSKGYLITPLSHYATQNKLNQIEILELSKEQILNACEAINGKHQDTVVAIRTDICVLRDSADYYELYTAPYPVMTEEEYVHASCMESAISMIDASRIDENDYVQAQIIHSRSYDQHGLLLLLFALFDTQDHDGVADDEKRSELVKKLDFAKLGFKQLTFDQRDEIFDLISDALDCDDSVAIIEFLKTVNCFIPSLETKITDNEEYPELIKEFDELSDVAVNWLKDNYITCALSERLCSQLYESEDYLDYIVATILRTGVLSIDEKIPFENYLRVYKDSNEVFGIMSDNWDFLELFQQKANFSEFDMDHIVPAYKTKQYERFFNHIDSLSPEEKKEYYKSFGKFASLNDSKAFRKLVCREDNMELLGDYALRDHIKEQLWEDDRADKAQFTKNWNLRWKTELAEKQLIEAD